MSLTIIRGGADCDNGRTCPHISPSGRGTLIVQGYLLPGTPLPDGRVCVEVPLDLLPEAEAEPPAGLHVTGHGTVVFSGPPVSDPALLAELTIPPGEAAIEIPAATLPFLEVTASA